MVKHNLYYHLAFVPAKIVIAACRDVGSSVKSYTQHFGLRPLTHTDIYIGKSFKYLVFYSNYLLDSFSQCLVRLKYPPKNIVYY